MFGLPVSTEYNKRIPKQKFYDNISVTPAMKRVFVEKIKSIYWRNKISPSTVNIARGDIVTEIEVFEIKLEEKSLDESVLCQIDKEIPYHIVFVLECDGKYQAWTAYKENAVSGKDAFKVGNYYFTDWLDETELSLKIDGLNADAVYENFVRQIAGEVLQAENTESLKASVERDNRRRELQKQITVLRQKVHNEKQINRQIQLNTELKKLLVELEDL